MKQPLQGEQERIQARLGLLAAWLQAVAGTDGILGHASVRAWLEVGHKPRLVYRTKSVCPRCLLVDGSPLAFVPADVVEDAEHQVHLVLNCKTVSYTHLTLPTIYSV